jgi:hypothetical protein
MLSLAWLLESRNMVPEDCRKGRQDPYTCQLMVNIGNRWVVKLLGGLLKAARSETLVRNNLKTIWDDWVLRRAFQLFGGIPRLKFTEANSGVPNELKRRLAEKTTTPNQG